MYKVLLVDDEVLIREAIEEKIDWSTLGFELIGSCENGKQAIACMEQNPPDLILTDICMPFVDGIELAKYVYEKHNNIKVVIISGYDNFEYAKSAIKFQVLEYILKPVTASELTETLIKVKEQLDSERTASKQLDKIKEAYQQSMPLLRERFLNQFVQGKERSDHVKDMWKAYDIQLTGEYYCVVQIQCSSSSGFIQEYEVEHELALFVLYNVAEEMLKGQNSCVVFQNASNTTTMIVAGESEYHLEERVNELCDRIQQYVFKKMDIETMAIVGLFVNQMEHLVLSYENLLSASEYQFLFEDNSIIYGREFIRQRTENNMDIVRWCERMNASLKQGAEGQICNDIKEFFLAMKKAYVTKSKFFTCVQSMVVKVVETVSEAVGEEDKLLQKETELFETLNQNAKMEEMEQKMKEFCVLASKIILASRENMGQIQAVKALDYIEKHYQESSLSLNEVCKYLGMSTSYFSVVFKNYTGETFIETLTKRRMEKAMDLLVNTDSKTYEVAEEVGYSDPHYFGSTFKKYVGETPKEYAKKRR